ncbi:hypothetical protein [Streptomyces sp. CT34]|uniref:hypothetical protein n=1 Tax=Streptomyces sp. CT34 TaxID=1553907 RepID=UPI0005BC5EF4|nr:hypothetical protein [Streptomyces sp. CT34]
MDEKTETDTKKKEKRIDLSLAQVSGSALAAAVAAYLAGQLSLYGTMIGAGVVSVIATTGGSIFQHLFRRTGEQIKEAAVTTRPKPRRFSTPRPRSTTGQADPAGPTRVLPTFDKQGAEDTVTSVARKPGPAAARTQLIPRAEQARRRDPAHAHPADDPTRLLRTLGRDATRAPRPANGAGRAGDTDGTDRTQLVPRLDERTVALGQAAPREAAATAVLPQAGGPGSTVADEEENTATYGTRLRGWKRPALGALAVFVLAMGAVTATELFTGETPSGAQGTTVGNLTTGFIPHRPSTPAPTPGHSSGSGKDGGSGAPSPGPSRSGDTGTGGGTDRGTPSPSTTPSDRGSDSPSPGTSSSAKPSPSHSTGTDGGSGDDSKGGATPGHQQSQKNPDTQQSPVPKNP